MSDLGKAGMNWTKLVIASLLICGLFSFGAMAKTKREAPLDADAVSALIDELKDGLPDLIEDEDTVTAITEKWDAREDLAGKSKAQILSLLFADVKSVVTVEKTWNEIWSAWNPKETIVNQSVNQNVNEIIAKHIEAIGGKDIIGKIQSIYMETSSQVMGIDAPGNITILNGKGIREETELNGSKTIQCFTDKSGWATNPLAGNTPEVLPEEQYKSGKAQIQIGGELFDYAAKGSKAELLGKDGNLYKIKLTTKDSTESTYYIDPTTYFIAKMTKTGEVRGQQVEVVYNYFDYRKTDQGFTIPYTTHVNYNSFSIWTLTITLVSGLGAAKNAEITTDSAFSHK